MKERRLLKEFCDAYKRRFKCPNTECKVCPYLMGIDVILEHLRTGKSMGRLIERYMRKPIKWEEAKKMISEIIGLPLEIVQSILRENE